jgi:hypothetical protein
MGRRAVREQGKGVVNPWWLGLSPAQATVTCSGEQHRLRWDAGELRPLDHDDPEAERALAALGGQRCTCVDVVDAWERHRDDPRVLVLARRGPTDRLALNEEWMAHIGVAQPQLMQPSSGVRVHSHRSSGGGGFTGIAARAVGYGSGWTGYAPIGRISRRAQAENDVILLLGLGGGLQDRLVATVAAAWRERLLQPDKALSRVRPQLRAALHGRAFAAIHDWLGGSELESQLSMIREGNQPMLVAEDGAVRAELPFGWLVDVWAKDLATIWGRFCVAAATSDGRTWELTTVGPDLGPPARVTLQLDAAPAG